MIELIVAAVSGVVVGGGLVLAHAMQWQENSKRWKSLQYETGDSWGETLAVLEKTIDALTALRANCFITNEKGHRVRYTAASVAARVKAEKPAGVA